MPWPATIEPGATPGAHRTSLVQLAARYPRTSPPAGESWAHCSLRNSPGEIAVLPRSGFRESRLDSGISLRPVLEHAGDRISFHGRSADESVPLNTSKRSAPGRPASADKMEAP